MKMDIVAGSGNDEFYTPTTAILPLVPYLRARNYKRIWCPFDGPHSNYVQVLTGAGFTVEYTHLDQGEDFFFTTRDCDCIVSNPPYSLKTEVFSRLFALERPFAMLVGVVGLFESQRRFQMFKRNPFEIMYFNRRISYFRDYAEPKPSLNPPFSSVYITQNLLPQSIVFETLDT